MPAKVILTVTDGNLKGQKFEFSDRTTSIIGRAKDCYPRLPNDEHHRTISRYHCLLDINPPDIRVRDFGSLHGTYINGKIIGKRRPDQTPEQGAKMSFPEYDLNNGDEIKLANTAFQVSIIVEATQPPPVVNSPNPVETGHNRQHLVMQANGGNSNWVAIEGYTTLKLLGEGGFGEVYLARDERTGKQVALKVMRSHIAAEAWAIERFLREVENTKALEHPNVVQLKESGYCNDTFFFTLEYCDGGSVLDLMQQRGGQLSIKEAISIALQALDGLEYAHNAEIPYVKLANSRIGKGRGLVHRDLKPSNIFLANANSTRITKVADYGLAKAFDLAGLSGLSMSGTKAGTPTFMPRQQVINFKYAKPEVDVWAMAACLYYMLTARLPRDFTGNDPFLVVLQTNPVPILQRDALIPKPLAKVIDLALIDNPNLHFKTAAAFKQALLEVL
jgi:serine/threonine protein kinase